MNEVAFEGGIEGRVLLDVVFDEANGIVVG